MVGYNYNAHGTSCIVPSSCRTFNRAEFTREWSREFSRAAQNARSQGKTQDACTLRASVLSFAEVLMLRHGLTGTEGYHWSAAPMTLRQVL